MDKTITKILTNDFDIIKHIYFCIYQIIYNITVILYEFDYYYERNNFSFIADKYKNFTITITNNNNCLIYFDDKYYRENNIMYLVRNNNIYWLDKNIYYVKKDNIIIEDVDKTFQSINERFFIDFNFINILNSIAKIINKFIFYNKYILVTENKIKFLNNCNLKIINLNFFFYLNNGFFYVKDIWEIIQDNKKENIMKIGMNLMYLYREFSSVNLKITSNTLSTKFFL